MKLDPATGLPVIGQGPSQQQIEDAQLRIKVMQPTRAVSPLPGALNFLDHGETVHDLYAARILAGMLSNPEFTGIYLEKEDGRVEFNVVALVEKVFEITAAAMAYRERYLDLMLAATKQREKQGKLL